MTVKNAKNEQYQAPMKNLWNNIRSKVFTNYSLKGLRCLIEWVVEKMSTLTQQGHLDDNSQDIAKLEINDTELQ